MKKNIFVILLFVITTTIYAQDQTVNGIFFQQLNNQWLSPAKLQLGRSKSEIIENKAVIGVTDGHLHLDSYPGKGLCLNYYQKDSYLGNKGMMINAGGNVGIGTTNPQYKLHVEGDAYTTGWVRVNGNQGLHFQSWGGGFHMTDAIWIRTFNNKSFYHNSGIMRTDGTFQIGPNGDRLVANTNGNVGIGITNPTYKLEVAGTIRSKEVKIEATGWADFVFDKDYRLPALSEVESHIKENKTLPGIPSESEVKENGICVGDMQAKLLQKIEELTLYVIEQDKKIDRQTKEISLLKEKNVYMETELINLKNK